MKSNEELVKLLKPFAPKEASEEILAKIIPLIKERIVKLSDFQSLAGFFFKRPKLTPSLFKDKNYKNYLEKAVETLQSIKVWNEPEITNALMALIEKNGWKTGDFFMALRIAITGSSFTPPINDSMAILGREETLSRLKLAAK